MSRNTASLQDRPPDSGEGQDESSGEPARSLRRSGCTVYRLLCGGEGEGHHASRCWLLDGADKPGDERRQRGSEYWAQRLGCRGIVHEQRDVRVGGSRRGESHAGSKPPPSPEGILSDAHNFVAVLHGRGHAGLEEVDGTSASDS